MDFFSFLSSREKKVSNAKLEANISKLCEELTTGIIQLSEKAKQLNELKDKYNKVQSEAQTTGASSETVATKPVKEKSLFSSLFGSSQDDTPPASPTTEQAHDDNEQPTEDNINSDMLSAAATASPEQAQSSSINQPLKDISQADTPQASAPSSPSDYNSITSSSVGSDATKSLPETPNAALELPPPDYNNISNNSLGSDAMQQPVPVPVPAATQNAVAAPSPSQEDALQNLMVPQAQGQRQGQAQAQEQAQDKSAINIGGKNRKKSKRSNKTIRRSNKKLNKVTKKQKINNADSGNSGDSNAKSQGLAQALLHAQGES
jgi:hypothetical protein